MLKTCLIYTWRSINHSVASNVANLLIVSDMTYHNPLSSENRSGSLKALHVYKHSLTCRWRVISVSLKTNGSYSSKSLTIGTDR